MNTVRVALANLRLPSTPDESVRLATQAIGQAGAEQADIICFPECYVPAIGHRANLFRRLTLNSWSVAISHGARIENMRIPE
jgi:predicted amidohydrolase